MLTLTVEALFTIRGRGTIVVGIVTAGVLPLAGAIGWTQQPDRPPLRSQIGGYEMPNPPRIIGVGVLIRGLDQDDLEIGQELTFTPLPERQEEIRARVRLLTPAEGGGRSPIKTGYHDRLRLNAGILGYNGTELSHGCIILLDADERMWPGDERVLPLRIECIPELVAKLAPSFTFTLTNGSVVAQGTVIEVRGSAE